MAPHPVGIGDARVALKKRTPRKIPPRPLERLASVALVLRSGRHGLEVLLIKRAVHERDRWSGQVALPGGKQEPGENARATAVRECFEEVGLQLDNGEEFEDIGRLDDRRMLPLPGSTMKSMVISVFVFYQRQATSPALRLAPSEVAAVIWTPLERLCRANMDPAHFIAPQHLGRYVNGTIGRVTGLDSLRFVSIVLTGDISPSPDPSLPKPSFVLWGLTLGIMSELLCTLGRDRLDVPLVVCERGRLMNLCIALAYRFCGGMRTRTPVRFLTAIKLSFALYITAITSGSFVTVSMALRQLGITETMWGLTPLGQYLARLLPFLRGPGPGSPAAGSAPRISRL